MNRTVLRRALLIPTLLVAPGADFAPAVQRSAVASVAVARAEVSERIAINDNRQPAGRLKDGVLTLRLEARKGWWYPEGPDGMARLVAAFAEEGEALQNPGPLIRVPVGSEVRVTVRNALDAPLTVFGLGETRGIAADSIQIDVGGVREVRFTAKVPGTYYYAARTTPVTPFFARRLLDSQLHGVVVVDSAGSAARSTDRVFVIALWGEVDSTTASGVSAATTMVINGLSWPHTERLDVAQGDSLHWRWVNLTPIPHPMHLHGFYFRVDGSGDGVRDTVYAPDQRRLAVTEIVRAGRTMAIAWSPDRPGNWIFHCHVARHMTPSAGLTPAPEMPATTPAAHASSSSSHAHQMARLVLGIRVERRVAAVQPSRPARPIRLLIRSRPTTDGASVRYAYVLGGSPEEVDRATLRVPGPTLIFEKDEPVAVTLVNDSYEPAAVHWHGIELESFPDGVPGWSGTGNDLLPAIAVGDSLTVRFMPPRAGTFMYHSHFNELQQISSGLYGPILVLQREQRHDPETDRVLLFSDSGPTINTIRGPFAPVLMNGRAQPEPLALRAGTTYRFRLINIRSDYQVSVALLQGDQPVAWRHVAKDGADLPATQAVVRPAELQFGVGEIYDVEFTPRTPGDLRLRFGYPPRFRPPGVPVPSPTVVDVQVR